MRQGTLKDIDDNFIEKLSDKWMLLTSGNKESFNTMTVNWGGIGFLWNKAVVFIFVRPERYTYEFLETNESFSLCFLKDEFKGIHNICGMASGRNINKIKEAKLTPIFHKSGCILFEQASISIECKKVYSAQMDEKFYNNKSFHDLVRLKGNDHKLYIAEIIDVWTNP